MLPSPPGISLPFIHHVFYVFFLLIRTYQEMKLRISWIILVMDLSAGRVRIRTATRLAVDGTRHL